MEGVLNYAVDNGLRAVIHIPSFLKNGSGIQKLIGGYTYRYTDTHKESVAYFAPGSGRAGEVWKLSEEAVDRSTADDGLHARNL
jgi:hypothetical protein